MRQILAVACAAFLALVLMDNYQVVKAPSGLVAVVKAGQAFAADWGDRRLPRLRPLWRQSARGKRRSVKAKEKVRRPS